MKFLIALLLGLQSISAFAGTIDIILPKQGRYIVTLKNKELCTPTKFSITTKETEFYPHLGKLLLRASLMPITDFSIRLAVCTKGENEAFGSFKVLERTLLQIDTTDFHESMKKPVIILEEVKSTSIIRRL